MSQFTLVRDFIITELVINNAQRSGVPASITLQDFMNAKRVDGEAGSNFMVAVTHHKTSSVYGPANICLSNSLYNWTRIYLDEVRSQVRGASEDGAAKLFITWNGADMTSSQVTTAMKSVWRKAGMEGNVSGTLVRKSAVSIVDDRHKDFAAETGFTSNV